MDQIESWAASSAITGSAITGRTCDPWLNPKKKSCRRLIGGRIFEWEFCSLSKPFIGSSHRWIRSLHFHGFHSCLHLSPGYRSCRRSSYCERVAPDARGPVWFEFYSSLRLNRRWNCSPRWNRGFHSCHRWTHRWTHSLQNFAIGGGLHRHPGSSLQR